MQFFTWVPNWQKLYHWGALSLIQNLNLHEYGAEIKKIIRILCDCEGPMITWFLSITRKTVSLKKQCFRYGKPWIRIRVHAFPWPIFNPHFYFLFTVFVTNGYLDLYWGLSGSNQRMQFITKTGKNLKKWDFCISFHFWGSIFLLLNLDLFSYIDPDPKHSKLLFRPPFRNSQA